MFYYWTLQIYHLLFVGPSYVLSLTLAINRKVPFFLLQSSFPLIVKLFLSAYKLQMQVLIIEMKSLFL